MKTPIITSIGILLAASAQISRAVPVVEYDISHSGDTATINGGFFETVSFGPTGTGVFQPFLDLQAKPGSGGNESAYNSSTWPLSGDNHRQSWNSDLLLDDLTKVTRNGKDYFLFTLDANEQGKGTDNKLLSIDRIQIYQSNTGGLNPGIANLSGLGSLQWDMDGLADSWLKIDSSLGSAGSGDADLNVYIPIGAFDSSKKYVYFFNQNGAQNGEGGALAADSGFEEWRALLGPSATTHGTVPDGGTTLASLGIALLGLGSMRKLIGSKAKA